MQSTTVTRSIAQVAFTLAQSTPQGTPSFVLSPIEEMAMLGISAEDFADRAHDVPLVDSEPVEQPTLPNYRDTPSTDERAYQFELGLLWQATRRAGMNLAKRHEGAAKYLQIPTLTSWKQLTPELMRRLRYAINSRQLTADWELAGQGECAVECYELPGIDEEDFARIVD